MSEDAALVVIKVLRRHEYMNIADQIEAQIPKPRPEEPKGLGAVVRNRHGDMYVRVALAFTGGGADWKHQHFSGSRVAWHQLDVAEVLFEGVEA